MRVRALNGAFKICADPDDAKSYLQESGWGSWEGVPKCNKYVGEVLWNAGVDIKIGRHWPVVWQLSDPKQVGRLRVVWQVKTKKEKSGDVLTVVLTQPLKGKPGMRPPRIGDIIIFGTAHVGIGLGHGIYISATSHELYDQKGVVIKGTADGYNLLYRSPDED